MPGHQRHWLNSPDRLNQTSISTCMAMTLAAEQGAELLFEVSGPDEEEAMEAIVNLVDNKFGMSDE